MHEYSYPYKNVNPTFNCPSGPYWNPGTKVTNYVHDYQCNNDKMKKQIASYGHANTVIWASDPGFQNYKSGIIDQYS